MPRTRRDVTEAELSVLRVLWDAGPSPVRGIADALTAQGPATHAATVQKLLERLEDKRWVERDRSGPVQLFRATADRDDLIGRRLRGIAEELCDGSLTPLLSHLVQNERLSAADRRALRDLIERLDENPKRKRSRRPDPPGGGDADPRRVRPGERGCRHRVGRGRRRGRAGRPPPGGSQRTLAPRPRPARPAAGLDRSVARAGSGDIRRRSGRRISNNGCDP